MSDAQDLVARSESLARLLVDGRFDDVWALFGDRMAVALPVDTLAKNWNHVRAKKLDSTELTVARPLVTVTVPVVGKKATVKVDVTWDAETQRVIGLYFRWS